MINYSISNLESSLKIENNKIAIHGAGDCGRNVLYGFETRGIKVDFFIDTDVSKQQKLFCGIKTISLDEFNKISPNGYLFIAHDYFIPVMEELKKLNFKNYYNSVDILENTNFSDGNDYTKKYPDMTPIKLERGLKKHKYGAQIAERLFNKIKNNIFTIKHMDVVITERCSLKCKDCANLMQYYEKPQNSDLEILFKSLDRMMECVDQIYEFRVLGGDPFMNKEMYKVVNKLSGFKNVEKVVVYTNAKIIPRDENLECLKNEKVRLDITNYGSLSSKHDEIIKLLNENNIEYETDLVELWDDIGEIKYEKKNNQQLKKVFEDCCAKEIFTILDGVVYKCPVSAHGTKLNAVPYDSKYDGVNLFDESVSIPELKTKLKDFHDNDQYVSACNYCKGRGYGAGSIKSAIQTKKPLPIEKISLKI
jgi:organic radical activating enzyme